MKRPRMAGRGPKPRGAVQVFTCGPFDFHIDRAWKLADRGRRERRWPSPEWVGPFIEIDEAHVEEVDLAAPILFATLVTDGRPWKLLIDGNHRVVKALRHGLPVETVTLDLADTLKVIRGPAHAVERMRSEGRRLGLLP